MPFHNNNKSEQSSTISYPNVEMYKTIHKVVQKILSDGIFRSSTESPMTTLQNIIIYCTIGNLWYEIFIFILHVEIIFIFLLLLLNHIVISFSYPFIQSFIHSFACWKALLNQFELNNINLKNSICNLNSRFTSIIEFSSHPSAFWWIKLIWFSSLFISYPARSNYEKSFSISFQMCS